MTLSISPFDCVLLQRLRCSSTCMCAGPAGRLSNWGDPDLGQGLRGGLMLLASASACVPVQQEPPVQRAYECGYTFCIDSAAAYAPFLPRTTRMHKKRPRRSSKAYVRCANANFRFNITQTELGVCTVRSTIYTHSVSFGAHGSYSSHL